MTERVPGELRTTMAEVDTERPHRALWACFEWVRSLIASETTAQDVEIERIKDAAEKMARRTNTRFVLDPDKVRAFQAAQASQETAAPAPAQAVPDALRKLLREVADKGLIYWEPQTARGYEAKQNMLARIDAALNPTGEA